MKRAAAPVLDLRSADEIARELFALVPGYVPGWTPRPGGGGHAIASIYARQLETLAQIVNRAPEKLRLAFYDALGLGLLPAVPARAPMTFQASPGSEATRVPAGTRVAAKARDGGEAPVFETERAIGLLEGRIAQAVSLWPARDEYADHSAALAAGAPFTLFENPSRVPHEWYLGHELHFALAGAASVELSVELEQAAAAPLAARWEYWDGKAWREFEGFASEPTQPGSFDGTAGFTRSGVVRLEAGCAETEPYATDGITSRWIRACTAKPLLPGTRLPVVRRVRVNTVVSHPPSLAIPALETQLANEKNIGPWIKPESAFADGQKLDLSKAFQPLGQNPGAGNAFYFSCEEAFSKPGAKVTVYLKRGTTPHEAIDSATDTYEAQVTAAWQKLTQAKNAGQAVIDKLAPLLDPVTGALRPLKDDDLFPLGEPQQWWNNVRNRIVASQIGVVAAIAPAAANLAFALGVPPAAAGIVGSAAGAAAFGALAGPPGAFAAANAAGFGAAAPLNAASAVAAANQIAVLVGLGGALLSLSSAGTSPAVAQAKLQRLQNDLTAMAATTPIQNIVDKVREVFQDISQLAIFLDDDVVRWAEHAKQEAKSRIDAARQAVSDALAQARNVVTRLNELTALGAAGVAGFAHPQLLAPQLAWEYWDGGAWQPLAVASDKPNARVLKESGAVAFSVPGDWEQGEINGTKGRWLRVRVLEGMYGKLRYVSWKDANSNNVNLTPIIEPRPPSLEAIAVGYKYSSPRELPQHCVTHNDFAWQEHALAAGAAFSPWTLIADATPALYLGFSRPPPADLLGIHFDIEESAARGFSGKWEAWDGAGWLALDAADETRGLALPGIVSLLWPGEAPRPAARIGTARDRELRLADARPAALFRAGDKVLLQREDESELTRVESMEARLIRLRAAPKGSFAGGTVAPAPLARFGTPASWLRFRLAADGKPPLARLRGIHPNTVWASQAQTLRDEVLGSSSGEPDQAFFLRGLAAAGDGKPPRVSVLSGERIEVRELEGPRAEIELPMLRRELAASGIGEADVNVVRDRGGNRAQAVWVRWQPRPHLLFSGLQDRHYVLDHANGRLVFGDGTRGKVPPAGNDGIVARSYRVGGGVAGNVAAGAISELMSAVAVQSVANPRPGEGGADVERVDAASERLPQTLRHRRQALGPRDYEALARDASPAVAVARAARTSDASGRNVPGAVAIVIVPYSNDAEPQPAFELRRQVRDYIAARAPAGLAPHIHVSAPSYFRIGVSAQIVPVDPQEAAPVLARAEAAVAQFLHPLRGGKDGRGWPFGRDLYTSDVARLLERTPGVDHVQSLALYATGVAQAEEVRVPPESIVSCGPVRIALAGAG